MRVLMLQPGPSFSVADVYWGWSKAFTELGCEVAQFNLDERMNVLTNVETVRIEDGERQRAFSYEGAWRISMQGLFGMCYQFWPDLVVNVTGFMVSPDVLHMMRVRGARVVTLCTESPYEDDVQLDRAWANDFVVLNDPTNLERFTAEFPRSYYQPHCYDPDRHSPGPVLDRLRSEFAFVGTGYKSRIEFFERVDWAGIDATFGGNWKQLEDDSPLLPLLGQGKDECCDNTETVDIYRSTKVSANLYRKEANADDLVDGWAMGPREVELAAVGTFFLTEERGENREVLPMVPTITTPEEFGDQVRFWLGADAERERIARAAREAVADRTFKNAAARLLQEVERLPVSVPLAG